MFKDSVDALAEMAEWQLPSVLAKRLAHANNPLGVALVLRDAIASVPGFLSWPLHVIAQRLMTRGTPTAMVMAAMIDFIPPLAESVRQRTGITAAQAQEETASRFFGQYASMHTKLSNLIGGPMATTPTPPATSTVTATTAAPVSKASRVQMNLTGALEKGAYTPDQRAVILMMFRILRIEGKPGSDVVAELEGEARTGLRSLVDTIADNSTGLKVMFDDIGEDFTSAMSCYEAIRELERAGDSTSDGRKAWRGAAASFVRHLIMVYEYLLLGNADRNPQSALASSAMDLMDNLNLFAGLEPSSTLQRAKKAQRTAAQVARGGAMAFVTMVMFFLVAVIVTVAFPKYLAEIALAFTAMVIFGSAVVTVAGCAIGEKTEILGFTLRGNAMALTGAFTMFVVAPIVLTVAWVLATFFATEPNWLPFWMTLSVVAVLDLITFSLVQKGLQSLGGLPSLFLSFFPNMEEAKAAAAKLAANNFLANISATIAGAIIMALVPVSIAFALEIPVSVRMVTIAIIVGFACSHAWLKRAATMRNYALYSSPEEAAQYKQQNLANARMAYEGLKAVTVGTLVLYGLIWWLGLATLVAAKEASANVVQRALGVAAVESDHALTGAERNARKSAPQAQAEPAQEPVRQREGGTGGGMLNCGGKLISQAKVEKRKRSLGGTPMPGTENGYPWNCH